MGVKYKSQARKRKQRQKAFEQRKDGWYKGQMAKLAKEFQGRLKREP